MSGVFKRLDAVTSMTPHELNLYCVANCCDAVIDGDAGKAMIYDDSGSFKRSVWLV